MAPQNLWQNMGEFGWDKGDETCGAVLGTLRL